MSPFDMAGKSVLVAGGAGYLGRPVCAALREAGADIWIADRDADRLAEAKAALATQAGPGAVETLPLEMDSEAAILECVAACGPLHGLVNATAASSNAHYAALTADAFDRTNRVNLTGTFLLARAAGEAMQAGGAMVLYGSMYGLVSPRPENYPAPMPPNPLDYGANKAGISQMARWLAAHYGPRGIRVNAVAPGPFPPQAVQDAHPEFTANLERDTMLGRMGRQHETAGPVLFLLSEAASYVTGQTLGIDGGWTSW